jgi:hypothetical protein
MLMGLIVCIICSVKQASKRSIPGIAERIPLLKIQICLKDGRR